ncbi:hypothetical protein N798_06820 [Knoellia flava TL1]|uniref:DUF2157 domain-containing protein n=2 Tax=Knoellia flava TaxID=913969 RepID=A0A8H9FTL4_9MICO|nr:hypothetical protein [Knoellia flava]KGN33106.1 hypothetical protein N798_06820 [Knoellia flava TL1]GGB71125.1 hypothetical protein GCM10011314_08110 [Knoellia flava]
MRTQTAPRPTVPVPASDPARAVTALEDAGLVSPDRHDEALALLGTVLASDAGTQPTATLRRRLGEVATYVGVAFVLAAVAVFLAPRWLDLGWVTRVAMIAGAGLVLALAGWGVARPVGGFAALRAGGHESRLRLVSVLLTGAAGAGAAAAGVAVLEQVQRSGTEMEHGTRVGLAGFGTLVVLAAAAYVLAPTLVAHAALVVGVGYTVPFLSQELGLHSGRPIGFGFLAAGVVWLVLAERDRWREGLAARLVGVGFLFAGAQAQLASDTRWVGYVLTFAVGVAAFLLHLTRRAWPYLVLGVAGVTVAVPEALIDWTEGTLGTAVALLGAGLALLLSGLLALRLRRDEPS